MRPSSTLSMSAKPTLEQLDNRDLPSLIGFPTHTATGPGIEQRNFDTYLVINGTSTGDQVEVRDLANNKIQVKFNGRTSTFSRAGLDGIDFRGNAGNDNFSSWSAVSLKFSESVQDALAKELQSMRAAIAVR